MVFAYNFYISNLSKSSSFAVGLTSLSFVGTINAGQAHEITEAIKTLVKNYLCNTEKVTIESVNYNRHNGYDRVFFFTQLCSILWFVV